MVIVITLGCNDPNERQIVSKTATINMAQDENYGNLSGSVKYKTRTFPKSIPLSRFNSDLEVSFKQSVDSEMANISEKAGLSIAVYTNDTIWTYAIGKADEGILMTDQTPLPISSTSKTFLSALVLEQVDEGLYDLTDNIGDLLSDHTDFRIFSSDKINPSITVENLLTMSSGLSDFNINVEGKSDSFKHAIWTPTDTVGLVQSGYVLPGAFKYNDTNVVLLGIIAEFHAGQSLAELYRRSFIEPLNLTAITLPEEGIPWHKDIFLDHAYQFTNPDMAKPYGDISRWSSGFGNIIEAAPFEFGYYIGAVRRLSYGCCGIVSTPENIARWAYELYNTSGSAISDTSRGKLLESFSDARRPVWGEDIYGYLAAKRTFRLSNGQDIVAYGHPGGGGGYSSLMRYSPELDLSISILANSEMKFAGKCVREKPFNCIANEVFSAYAAHLE